ncbi:MAG TPA: NYN domain-containing protein [Candidatus Magasanikbacteria bacterium]|nr:NYN domain-containing protein [Candidatus Magasanikbacteria bacterium]
MDITDFKGKYYFFNNSEYGRVFVFVDFGNVRPWAKDLWPEENKFRYCSEIDIEKLAQVCNWVNPEKKLFYYGHFKKITELPEEHRENIKSRNSIFRINKAQKSGFQVKTKEVKMIPHYDENGKFLGKTPKCNFDVEITMDMLTKINKYDTVMLFSGDSDFGGLLSYLKTKGKKIVVVCTRNRMSIELEKVADVLVPAETLKEFLMYIKNTPPLVGTEV